MNEIFLRHDPNPSVSPNPQNAKIILRDGKIAADEACCCNCGCFLPYTATVVFTDLKNKTHSQHCHLTITSNFGSGAFAVGMLPGGCDDNQPECGPSNRGPLTSVLLVDGGSGYAFIGRKEPDLNIKGSGKNAIFTPTFAIDNSTAYPMWTIQSIAISGNGTGYTNGEILQITPKSGSVTVLPAVATLYTNSVSVQPNVNPVINGPGNGAVLSAFLQQNNPPNWGVSSVNVVNGGTGYFGQYPPLGTSVPVEFNTDGQIIEPALANAYPLVTKPENFSQSSTAGGIDCNIQINLDEMFDGLEKYWIPTSFNIINGGLNFVVGEYVAIRATGSENESNLCDILVTEVDANGTIVNAVIEFAGVFRECVNGSVGLVNVSQSGKFFKDAGNGEPLNIVINNPGRYYQIDKTVPPCVANITVIPCGGGFGAEIQAVVDQNVDSETFGQIIALNITNSGSNYLVWEWQCTSHSLLNNKPFVLRAQNPRRLVNLELKSCFGDGAEIQVDNKGARLEPTLKITAPCSSDATGPPNPVISYTLTQHQESNCNVYWSIASVDVVDNDDCYIYPGTKAAIASGDAPDGCQTVILEQANIDLVSDNNGLLIGANVVSGGKYYQQFEWNGQPSPIYSVSIQNPGNGYAKRGREQPSSNLSINTLSGNGAVIDYSIIQKEDHCGIPYWIVDSLSINDPGIGYKDFDTVSIIFEESATVEESVSGTIFTNLYEKPEITGTVISDNGTGVDIRIIIDKVAQIVDGRLVRGWQITNVYGCGGTNYQDGDYIQLNYDNVTEYIPATFKLTVINGKITCIDVLSGGLYKVDDDGSIKQIKLLSKGKFYKENNNLQPYIADIEILVHQEKESNGSGAVILVAVEDNPFDLDFGKIKEIILEDCGQNYSYFGGPLGCIYSGGCQVGCGISLPSITMIMPNRKNKPINVILQDDAELPITIHLRSTDILDCNNPFPSQAYLLYGAESANVSIESGGLWDSSGTDNCPGDCVCPADLLEKNPYVDITSTIPCADGTTADYTGPWADIDFNCGYKLTPESSSSSSGEIEYINDIEVSIYCCPVECDYDDDKQCILKIKANVSGYCYDPETETWRSIYAGEHECTEIEVVDGLPVGCITFPVIAIKAGFPDITYSMTICFGEND